jgi:hypothetical protein
MIAGEYRAGVPEKACISRTNKLCMAEVLQVHPTS